MEKSTNTELDTSNAGAWARQYQPIIKPEIPKWMLTVLSQIVDNSAIQIEIAEATIEEWHSPIGIQSRSTGFNPQTFLPTKGPDHDRHHTQLLQTICASSGLSLHNVMDELAELSTSGTLPHNNFAQAIDILRVFALPHRCIPQGWKLRRAMSYILSGHFGEEPRKKLLSTMLMWTLAIHSPYKNLRRYTTADHTSFDLLNQIIESLGNHAQATEEGLIVTGETGTVYKISPSSSFPYYHVSCKLSGTGLCIPPKRGTEGLPLGDHLCGLVLGLRNDIATSERIELLRMFLTPRLRQERMEQARRLIEESRRLRRAMRDSGGEEE